MPDLKLIPLPDFQSYPAQEMQARAADLYTSLARRRTVRDFSDKPIPPNVLDDCLRVAGSAPNGANMQPWHFVVVTDPQVKSKIRVAAEEEERAFYSERASPEWLEALRPLGTDSNKPFLETAPALVVIFAQSYGLLPDGRRVKHYYAQESVGIATGMLIIAVHNAGLASLTHTPSPMKFLNSILNRPNNEKPFLVLVVGYPADNAQVPDITKKPLDEIVSFV